MVLANAALRNHGSLLNVLRYDVTALRQDMTALRRDVDARFEAMRRNEPRFDPVMAATKAHAARPGKRRGRMDGRRSGTSLGIHEGRAPYGLRLSLSTGMAPNHRRAREGTARIFLLGPFTRS
jgi:hypothetical protein